MSILRMILLVIVGLSVLVGTLGFVLVHFFGWMGFLAFPVVLLGLVWIGRTAAGTLFKRVALGLFGMKARVLRGAGMTLHSVVPAPRPDPGDGDRLRDEAEDHDEEPKEYFRLDVTITPDPEQGDRLWEPGELILCSRPIESLEDLEDDDTSHAGPETVRIWDGSGFAPDDPGKYPGQQRLEVVFGVPVGATTRWLCYYHEVIGKVELSRALPNSMASGLRPPTDRA